MAYFKWDQVVFTSRATIHNETHIPASSCRRVWDPVQARFDECFLPFISATPAGVAVFVLILFLARPLRRYRPRWTNAFVSEHTEIISEQPTKSKNRRYSLTCLLIASVAGLVLSCVAFMPSLQWPLLLPASAWTVEILLLSSSRPHTTPWLSMILLLSILVSNMILLFNTRTIPTPADLPSILSTFVSLGAIVIILCMPLRNPNLCNSEIGTTSEKPTQKLRTPEDNLSLFQFLTITWMSPLISLGSERQLNGDDVWSLGYEFQHNHLHENFRQLRGSVIKRLIYANGIDLVLTSLLEVLELLANYSVPVLLQQLLRSMQNSNKGAAVTYAILMLVVRLISSQCDVLGLWFSRRCYERSRGEMITMLYEKTLSRKLVTVHKVDNPGISSRSVSEQEAHPQKQQQPFWIRTKKFFARFQGISRKREEQRSEAKEPASMGKILNLMRNDVYEVAQRFWEFKSLTTKPVGLVFSIGLIYSFIGWPGLFGIVTIIIAQVLSTFIARAILRWEKVRRAATDSKLQIVTQFVEAIRHLRWYGWQNEWLSKIMEARQLELRIRVITSLWNVLMNVTNFLANGLFPCVAFYAYTSLAGLPLTIDVAFPSLQLFIMLQRNLRDLPPLITSLLNAYIAINRIEDFMSEPDKTDVNTEAIPKDHFELKNASFGWPGSSETVLEDITLSFPIGLTVICGQVGAGKSALLQALLGELDCRGGQVTRPNEMVGYCAQTPWLQGMSIRENILFFSPYEERRYTQVLEVCALDTDMMAFKDGDLSNIGESGIGLSGGQKARVALARAVYSTAKVLLLDDPLSALDHQTAESIVQKCFAGPLLAERTTILVTHRTELCQGLAVQVIEVFKGRAKLLDTSPSSLDTSNQSSSAQAPEALARTEEDDGPPAKFIEDEHRSHGGVQASVYWEYVKAGQLRWWFVLLAVLLLYRLLEIGESWFLKSWGEGYDHTDDRHVRGLLDHLPSPDDNINPWLIGFLLLAVAQAIMVSLSQGIMLIIIYQAGRRMFTSVMTSVSYATFRYYDTTPVGRLMNRLTSDISTIDRNISQQFQTVARRLITWVSSVVVIASITPVFLVFSVILTLAFVLIFRRFLPTSQSLRRLEMVSLSPLMSNFGALLEGLTTVRAFNAQPRFQARVITVTDDFQKMDHFYWSLQAWLTYRFDILSASSTLALTLLALYTHVSPALTAFLLIAASEFVTSTHGLCQIYGRLQMDFVSVERIVELLHLEQEAPGPVSPPAWWPLYTGDIVFEDVTVKYAPHLEPSLADLSFTIKGGSSTVILGRTGSGKSTLALALLATIIPEKGRILIDNVDIATVDKQALRRRITFLAQDPVLFPGTMRQNLDPLEEHPGEACESVLQKVCGRHHWTLDTHIDTGGRNLSQGQRQLVGLARAILRRSAIVILDEATASIDVETATQIQQILREEMRESTVITIAHRLEAVKDATHCIVLGKGRVIKQGLAPDMLNVADGNLAVREE